MDTDAQRSEMTSQVRQLPTDAASLSHHFQGSFHSATLPPCVAIIILTHSINMH